jgi:hypothetical protein
VITNPQDEKLDLLAGIVTQMVAQQAARTARMEAMQGDMMKRGMEHAPMGNTPMSPHPMMNGTDDQPAATPAAES